MRFKVGDRVKIKSWDELAQMGVPQKSRVDHTDEIYFPEEDEFVVNEMKELCGQEAKVIGSSCEKYTLNVGSYCKDVFVHWNFIDKWLDPAN